MAIKLSKKMCNEMLPTVEDYFDSIGFHSNSSSSIQELVGPYIVFLMLQFCIRISKAMTSEVVIGMHHIKYYCPGSVNNAYHKHS